MTDLLFQSTNPNATRCHIWHGSHGMWNGTRRRFDATIFTALCGHRYDSQRVEMWEGDATGATCRRCASRLESSGGAA